MNQIVGTGWDLRVANLERVLSEDGGLYTIDDIKALIAAGQMQAFERENTIVITQIFDAPKKRVMNIVAVAGTMEELISMEPEIDEFARQYGVKVIGAAARFGFDAFKTEGWVKVSTNYRKELS